MINWICYQIQKKSFKKIKSDFIKIINLELFILLNIWIIFEKRYIKFNFDLIRDKIFEWIQKSNNDLAKSTQMFTLTLIFIYSHLFKSQRLNFWNNIYNCR